MRLIISGRRPNGRQCHPKRRKTNWLQFSLDGDGKSSHPSRSVALALAIAAAVATSSDPITESVLRQMGKSLFATRSDVTPSYARNGAPPEGGNEGEGGGENDLDQRLTRETRKPSIDLKKTLKRYTEKRSIIPSMIIGVVVKAVAIVMVWG